MQPTFASEKITTVFLDMGSTLSRLQPGWKEIYHQVFQKAGLELPLDEVEAAVSYSWSIVGQQDPTAEYITTLEYNRQWQREVEERVMERLQIQPTVREDIFWQIIEAFESPASYALYPETLTVLDRLQKKGYRLAIISNWSWHLPELCDALNITGYFEKIFTSARIGYAKPHPQIFQRALQEMNITAEQAIHIGDSYSADVVGASEQGIKPLWLVRPEEFPLYEENPDRTIRPAARIANLHGILDFLEQA